MNKDAILKYQIYSAIFAIILGTLLHFTYEWSNYNALIGTFSSVNESTWEHLKLAFFPMLITTIIGFFKFKNVPNFLCSKMIGIVTALGFITSFFYTYTGILGKNLAIIDILSFMFSVILGEYVSYKKIMSDFKGNTLVCILILVVLSFCFIIFTYNPPKIQLFQDPLTGLYGMF
ncbi:MAG: hypothetical protein IKN09_01980 [Clostridia bacterium]|nr:hypothetical protein [Clostridia bacterium]MBR4261057.1 hypothetical protein [Clostridia bacterium]